jgi:hypothetical protein
MYHLIKLLSNIPQFFGEKVEPGYITSLPLFVRQPQELPYYLSIPDPSKSLTHCYYFANSGSKISTSANPRRRSRELEPTSSTRESPANEKVWRN